MEGFNKTEDIKVYLDLVNDLDECEAELSKYDYDFVVGMINNPPKFLSDNQVVHIKRMVSIYIHGEEVLY